jgi:CRISPR-associated endonuclease/helicase Cas3
MSDTNYAAFFKTATGGSHSPYEYQSRLALGEADLPNTGAACHSRLINIPTGLGKTAAVVLAWMWNRVVRKEPAWPRRLVYCLPMRTLVEQTEKEVKKWLGNLLWDEKGTHDGKVGLHTLMGGEDAGEWDIHPEREAILIGTQDMLLSRALNRGYGMSRYRWPMHFGLLNNDALWVMDETQLMGVGVETSAQLDGFRAREEWRTHRSCPTWWMSATLEQTRLATVDHPAPDGGWLPLKLSPTEESSGRPHELITAKKKLSSATLKDAPAPLVLSTTTKDGYAKRLAELVTKRHLALLENPHPSGTLTLVIVNRVSRAREIFEALTMGEKKGKQTCAPERVALIHSRFRQKDRAKHEALLFGTGDRIVIATQAVEAGVDVSARLLITELAPWSSLVQRMGRCNRRAEFPDAEILWVNIEPDAKGELLLPYTKDELTKASEELQKLTDACPRALREIIVQETPVVRPVIRRRDLVDLFDTTPDICGQDLDISRYIRDSDDNDVQFFWRDIAENETPGTSEPQPTREELCRVSIGDAAKFLDPKKKTRAWQWNPLEKEWKKAGKPRPGAVYLVAADCGGYEDRLGWTGEPKPQSLTIHRPPDESADSHDGNGSSFTRDWQSLAEHTGKVIEETDSISAFIMLSAADAATLRIAALWHDVGKAHGEFQRMLCDGEAPPREGKLWAKSKNKTGKCKRPGFRHELASALAWLLAGSPNAPERDLVAYLIAAHHGKVRLSIRSLPNEPVPGGEERLFARGIWHGDTLPAVAIGDITTPALTLDLSFMKMGAGEHGPSWLARTVALRDRLGPFRLAYLETILRAADARASSVNAATTN